MFLKLHNHNLPLNEYEAKLWSLIGKLFFLLQSYWRLLLLSNYYNHILIETKMGLLEGFPLNRQMTHSIELQPGFGSVSVRPYMYPYHHKDEIGKQVQWILKQDIIRHCCSAFSSPVILVKKKENTWRMCVDYRQLNKVTILDKYLIPAVEDLLDELHKARYFSKINLKSGYHQIRWGGRYTYNDVSYTWRDLWVSSNVIQANQKKCNPRIEVNGFLGHNCSIMLPTIFPLEKHPATRELELLGFLGRIVV